MVSGGVAAILYGEPRLTQAIDVVVAMQPRDAMRFAQQFPDTDVYCPPVEVIAQETERNAFGHFNVLHLESDARADVYLARNDILLQKLRFRQRDASAMPASGICAMFAEYCG